MSERTAERARTEAAGWLTRLSQPSVTTEQLKAFRSWKSQPDNAAAYAKLEATWDAAGRLADDPDIHAATAEALQRQADRSRGYGGALLAASLTAAVGLAAFMGWRAFGPQSFQTGTGEQRLVVLSDGSRVRLNTDSLIRVSFGPRERDIRLARGEAFFEAAHDPTRPFIVQAGEARVRAIGTKFDVRRNDGTVRVTLLEGRVGVQADGGAATTLAPNQQLIVRAQAVSAPQPVDAVQAASWTTGRLVFRGMPLQDAVAEINRYTPHKLVLDAPPSLAREPVTGAFDIGDTAAFTAAADTLFGLKARRLTDGSVRLEPTGSAPGA